MIINIRGTHGSGKSTVVRSVMEHYTERQPFYEGRRTRPLNYLCNGDGMKSLYIPGSYENATGGCDTITSIQAIFFMVEAAATAGLNVLYEGILAQHSAIRLKQLHDKHPVTVIVLDTPLEVCIDSVKERRASRGEDGEFDPRNVIKEYQSVQTAAKKLRMSGIDIHYLDRQTALEYCLERLRT